MTEEIKRPRGRPRKVEPEPRKPGRPVGSKNKATIEREKRPVGRPKKEAPKRQRIVKNTNYMSFAEAKHYLQGEMIQSSTAYKKWWDKHKPETLSKWPHRVYREEWKGWNDFLGTDNKFESNKQRWRPYDLAVEWAQTLKLETEAEWKQFCASGKKPDDIPVRPDLSYRTWTSWNYWLGYRPADKLKAAQAVLDNMSVFFIIHKPGYPENVLTYGVEPRGLWALKQRWEREPYEIIRFFKFDSSKQGEIQRITRELTYEYQGEGSARVTPNVWEVLWYLSEILEVITDYSNTERPSEIVAPIVRNDDKLKTKITSIADLPDITTL